MKVIVYGYTERFAVSPDVSIYKDGELFGSVGRGGKVELNIDEPCELKFKCSLKSIKCVVDTDAHIVLAINRIWGGLTATTVVSESEALQVIGGAKSADSKRIMWFVIVFGVLLLHLLFFGFLFILFSILA